MTFFQILTSSEFGFYFSLCVLVMLTVFTANFLKYKFIHSSDNVAGSQPMNFLTLFIIYKNYIAVRKTRPLTCLIHQYLCGVCKLFDQQKMFLTTSWVKSIALIFKPETVEAVLKNPASSEKAQGYEILQPWMGTGLLTSNGEKWRLRRKLLTPCFHLHILEDFIGIFDEQSQVLVSKLKALDGNWVDISPLITMCTLDIICQTAMGVYLDAQNGGCSEYVKAIHEVGRKMLHRSYEPWLYSDTIFYLTPSGKNFKSSLQVLHNFTRQVIKEKKESMMNHRNKSAVQEIAKDVDQSFIPKKKGRIFLELLLEHHLKDETLTEEDIREEVDTFMFAGHDTTATSIIWTLYNVGLHSEVQENIFEELDSIFESDITRPITRDDLTHMKYLECVIKETLRLYPSAPLFAREIKEDIEILGYKLCAGTQCIIFPFMLHRDPETFPNPEKFDPERFFLSNCRDRNPYAFIPFSAGQRNCIGQRFAMLEAKTILANIFRNFRVESLDPKDKIDLISDLIIRTLQPIKMRFIARH